MSNPFRGRGRPHLSAILASIFYTFDKHSGPRPAATSASDPGGLFSHIKEPVRRAGAERYLLITLLAFAASVVSTRILLELTGYPQVGDSRLHIAHVLWGGLLLFVASLLPLIFANRWVFSAGALLSGIGVGLFIDEVGKFITRTNDYFYPPAAPIIYAFFLLTVMVYLRVRRPPRHEPRTELYGISTYSPRSWTTISKPTSVRIWRQVFDGSPGRLESRNWLDSPIVCSISSPRTPSLWHLRLRLSRNDWSPGFDGRRGRYLGRKRLKALLIGGFLLLGVPPLAYLAPLLGVLVSPVEIQREFVAALIATGSVTTSQDLHLLVLRVALTALAGLPLLLAAGYLLAGRDQRGMEVAHFGLLLYLSAVNLLVFYFDQFQAVGGASIQFALLLGTIHYRQRYLAPAAGIP